MIKLFGDCTNFGDIINMADNKDVVGFTISPAAMAKAKVTNYESFARASMQYLSMNRPDTCISLPVIADDLDTMHIQANKIIEWSRDYNDYKTYIAIPVTTSDGISTAPLYKGLSDSNTLCNITNIYTVDQIEEVVNNVNRFVPNIISICAGGLADNGINPKNVIISGFNHYAYNIKNNNTKLQFLWDSPKQAYDYNEAYYNCCDIIAMDYNMIYKTRMFGKDAAQCSLDEIKRNYNDCVKVGLKF